MELLEQFAGQDRRFDGMQQVDWYIEQGAGSARDWQNRARRG
jgi:hypothetical protein